MIQKAFQFLTAIAWLFLVVQACARSRPSDAELAAITERGALLAEYDRAAWQASDAVKAAHPLEGRISRYIARRTVAGWVVDFGRLNDTREAFLVAYEAVQTGAGPHFEVKGFDPVRVDTGWNLAAARGIETAIGDFGGMSRAYNVAVLPAERQGMYVYMYPAQVKAGVYPLGGDVRYDISRDGTTIIDKHQMHTTILESVPPRSQVRVAVGYHSHALSDLPEDTDVMLVLIRRPKVPEIVVAGAYMFTIDVNGTITVEDRAPSKKGELR